MENKPFLFKNVCLCDDDPDEHLIFEKAFHELLPFASCSCFISGDDLLNYLTHHIPDLVFLDINLPKIDGKEVLRLIRQNPSLRKLPVVMYTGSTYPMDVRESYGYGANLYLSKPVKYEELVKQLTALLKMDWGNPERITGRHITSKGFVPFSAE